MLKKFPEFSALQSTDRQLIQGFSDQFESYSDFNFTSLISWDVERTAKVSDLNGNIVINIPHYTTGEPLYSILGTKQIDKSLQELLATVPKLELVPEVVVKQIKKPGDFIVNEDRDHFDYVYYIDDLVALAGKAHKTKRNKINHFYKAYPHHEVKHFIITDKISFEDKRRVFFEWALERDVGHNDVTFESKALDQFIAHAEDLNLVGVEQRVDDKPIGFSINEILSDNKTAICHFQKSIHTYKHADTALTHHVSKALQELGVEKVNWEQDLGLLGLRQLKEGYKPSQYLKKYIVRK